MFALLPRPCTSIFVPWTFAVRETASLGQQMLNAPFGDYTVRLHILAPSPYGNPYSTRHISHYFRTVRTRFYQRKTFLNSRKSKYKDLDIKLNMLIRIASYRFHGGCIWYLTDCMPRTIFVACIPYWCTASALVRTNIFPVTQSWDKEWHGVGG